MSHIRTTALHAALALSLVACSSPQVSDPSALIGEAIASLGGYDRLVANERFDLQLGGTRWMIDQSRRGDPPWDPEPSLIRVIRDGGAGRWLSQNETTYPGLGTFGSRVVVAPQGSFSIDHLANSHGNEVMSASAADTAAMLNTLSRFVPGMVLQAAQRIAAGEFRVLPAPASSRDAVTVAYTNSQDREVRLRIHPRRLELLGYASTRPDPVYGVVADSIEFDGYRDVAGLRLPTERREYFNGTLSRQLSYRVSTTPVNDSLFTLPSGFERTADGTGMSMMMGHMDAPEVRTLRRVGRGLYADRFTNALVAEFQDFVAVFDCPNTSAQSQATIDAIGATLPGKSVRYLIASHTHADHCGAARPYYAIGATVITAADHANFYRRLAEAKHDLAPDAYSANPRPPIIETLASEEQRVITDGTQRVEIRNVGASPHTAEALIAIFPNERLLWQVDFYLPRMTGPQISTREVEHWFGRYVLEQNLQFTRLIDPHSGALSTREEFLEALRRGRLAGHS